MLKIKKTALAFCSLILILLISIFIVVMMYITIDQKFNIPPKISSSEVNTSLDTKKLTIDFTDWNMNCDWNLLVINSQNPIPKNYEINLKPCRDSQVDTKISCCLNDMIEEAFSQNIKLWISSGYRSESKQNELFTNKVKEYINRGYSQKDSESLSQTIVAKPGTSEHNLGLAVDLNGVQNDFNNTKEFSWLIENAHNYGFILRYDNSKQNVTGKIYEPWHFRFVGIDHAKKMKEKNLCLEEYVSELILNKY